MHNGIIIVNYNRKELLKKCLRSLFLSDTADFHIFVVDNGSEDGSIEMMRNDFAQVTVIEMGYNSGFCKANNVGIQRAIDSGCAHIILLNNDTEVDRSFVSELVGNVNAAKRIDMVAPKILMHTDRNIIDSAGIIITPDGLAKNRFLDHDAKEVNESCEVFCPTGAAALFTARLLTDIKQDGMYFDENFAYYFEDLDLGWRARLRGWRCWYNPKSLVYHHKNATSGGYSKFIAFHTNRNIFYNIIKNYPFPYCAKAVFLSIVRYPLLLWGGFIGRGPGSKFGHNISKLDLIIVVLKGWRDVIFNSCRLLAQRRYIQRRKKVSRKECHGWFESFGLSFFAGLYK